MAPLPHHERLAGVLGWSLLGSLRASQLRDAAAQLSADLRAARSTALKSGQNVTVTTTLNAGSYTVQRGADTRTLTLPSSVQVSAQTAAAVQYRAPSAAAPSHKGPALVTSNEYRDHWDGIFGTAPAPTLLN